MAWASIIQNQIPRTPYMLLNCRSYLLFLGSTIVRYICWHTLHFCGLFITTAWIWRQWHVRSPTSWSKSRCFILFCPCYFWVFLSSHHWLMHVLHFNVSVAFPQVRAAQANISDPSTGCQVVLIWDFCLTMKGGISLLTVCAVQFICLAWMFLKRPSTKFVLIHP